MRPFVVLGLNDLRSIGRDPLLIGVVCVPWLVVGGIRLVVPLLTTWLTNAYGIALEPHYPLLVGLFCLVQVPLLFGMLGGFLILEERDDGVLTALRVTPLSLRRYTIYRVGAVALISMAVVLISTPLSGLVQPRQFPLLVPLALLAGLLTPVVALLLAAVASNKVEGIALSKAFGILLLGPLVAYFIASDWQLMAGVLPSYWLVRAYLAASAGEAAWPYLLGGLVYQLLLLGGLMRWFQRHASR